jgi:hypothetical protein
VKLHFLLISIKRIPQTWFDFNFFFIRKKDPQMVHSTNIKNIQAPEESSLRPSRRFDYATAGSFL